MIRLFLGFIFQVAKHISLRFGLQFAKNIRNRQLLKPFFSVFAQRQLILCEFGTKDFLNSYRIAQFCHIPAMACHAYATLFGRRRTGRMQCATANGTLTKAAALFKAPPKPHLMQKKLRPM